MYKTQDFCSTNFFKHVANRSCFYQEILVPVCLGRNINYLVIFVFGGLAAFKFDLLKLLGEMKKTKKNYGRSKSKH